MVARNFPVQDLSYSRLLQIPDDEKEFISLEELKPVSVQNVEQPQHPYEPSYYELSNMIEQPCSSTIYQTNQPALDSSNSSLLDMHNVDSSINTSRKRKASFHETSDVDDDAFDDSKSVKTTDENKKQNHSEIEKRRRDKMNTYITELSSIVPMCHAMSRKLDKLTILRMAVQHLKTIRGAVHSYTEGHYKPSFLSDQELKHLILQATDGFLFVVGCDRGRILYLSESVSKVLHYSQDDLLGQSLFDILHPKDVAKVKEQLSSSDLNPRERLIDAKTMLPVKTDVPQGASRLCPGARRSFFCRMKCKLSTQVKEEADTTTGCHRIKNKQSSDKKYNVIQCTGYLKSWAPAKIGLEEQEGEGDSYNLSCLVAIGRILPHISTVAATNQSRPNGRSIQFISRHALDGKFLFVDQRATLVLGFLPQELLGTSMYEYYHHDDISFVADYHKNALQNCEKVTTSVYRFRTKDGSFIKLQSEWKPFKNPWTKEVEYLISKNNLILTVESTGKSDEIQENFDANFFTQTNGKDMQQMISNHIEASKIGRQIADQMMDSQRRGESPTVSADSEAESSREPQISTSRESETPIIQEYSNSQNHYHTSNNIAVVCNISNDAGAGNISNTADDRIIGIIEDAAREPTNEPSTDGNDEAAMAVIMSLLEADAGLGGPVDFTGLPWPLP
ncbi:PREDICTED: protein cycle isoform X2 [Nicrophorus vespilloides]|uniref:Protein cycle isoform X2 n=1 Tax=Nicrophorus vespilloides TaxID=110193 RepID=A0ABM1MGX9_NICVS|nr:PREDICTED: protein cycle isoform X2 [Nicrophorus vespilloides]